MKRETGSLGGKRWEPPSEPLLKSVVVRPIRAEEESTWDSLMSEHHYLGFRRLVGEFLKYVALLEGEWAALLGWSSAAFACGPRDRWIGWCEEQKTERLRYIVNNSRFLVLPAARVKNLASKVLALNIKRISQDWEGVYGHPLLLAETFIDQERFAGSCYIAAGWIPLGKSLGYGRNGGRYFFHGKPKTVLVRALCDGAREALASEILTMRASKEVFKVSIASIKGKGGLMEVLKKVRDFRKRRGIRHPQATVLAISVCAMMAGARSFVGIAEWACTLSQRDLKKLGCHFSEALKRYVPPSEPTIRRVLQSIDADEVDRVLGEWLEAQCAGDAIALDGKTLRGARRDDGKRVHLLSALLQKEKVVIAQKEVSSKSNEISSAKPLLESVNLEGRVVTADAMHAQTDLAKYIVGRGADYVFIVKRNQRRLLEDIKGIEDDDFSPLTPRVGKGSRPD